MTGTRIDIDRGEFNMKRIENKQIIKEVKELLMQNFPDYIDKVILFGSQARGDYVEFSDYDILVVLKKSYDWKLKNKIHDKTWEIGFKYDILTDIKLISNDELNTIKGKQPFIQQAFEHGIMA
ncbi:MAG: nucleotidyltransferase domain-containing protein [Desulfamplus sp.]|nr:nucleotidyltransferase domain-containing protein [Desulfamplus sp.]